MNRAEMLNKLHTTPVSVRLTALDSEGSLECLYMTSKGTKEEWIGINDWPVSIIEHSAGTTYVLTIKGKQYTFKDYQSFSDFFEQNWICEISPWEDYTDEALEEWLELISLCNGIPLTI